MRDSDENRDVPDKATQAGQPVSGQSAQWPLAMALAALVLSLIGQFYFSFLPEDFGNGILFFVAGVAVLAVLCRKTEKPAGKGRSGLALLRLAEGMVRERPIRTLLVFLGGILSYTTLRLLEKKTGNAPYWDVFALWLMGMAAYGAAFAVPRPLDFRKWAGTFRTDILLVSALTAVAAALRLTALGSVPNVISGDEGRIGLLAESAMRGELNNMLATTYGHGTLYLYAMAGFLKILGVSAFSLRVTSALSGTLSVPALYIFARRFFGTRVAFISASILTFSHIHIHFSRIIVAGSIQDAFFSIIIFYLLLSGLESRSRNRLLLAGLVAGVFLYIYMGARLTVMLSFIFVLVLAATCGGNRRLVRQNLANLLIFAGMLAIAAAPLGHWAIHHPDEFNARINQTGIFQSGWLEREAVITGMSKAGLVFRQLGQAFLTINYYPAEGFYYSRFPMLDYLSGALFVLGLAYSLLHLREPRHLLLNGWLWAGLLVGGALIVLPAQGAYRVLMILPAVCLFAGIAWDLILKLGWPAHAASRRGMAAAGLIVALTAALNVRAYFFSYAMTCRYEDTNTRFASFMGAHLGRLGTRYTAYLLGAPRIWYGIHPSVDFLSGGNPIKDINDPLTAPPAFLTNGRPAVFYFTPEREGELRLVQQCFTGGEVTRIYDCGNLLLISYHVP
jgi:4-amino-4-deoxy-L-arabinose transferase-like glycosyltransferase